MIIIISKDSGNKFIGYDIHEIFDTELTVGDFYKGRQIIGIKKNHHELFEIVVYIIELKG